MTTTRVPGPGGIWQSEHDFRDKHPSQFTIGRFVLLPKDLVTGAAKARIVSRPTRPANAAQVTGRALLWKGDPSSPGSVGASFCLSSIWDQNLGLGPRSVISGFGFASARFPVALVQHVAAKCFPALVFAEADGKLAALQFPLCFSGPVWQRIGPFSLGLSRG
jgi:hypothetical protein